MREMPRFAFFVFGFLGMLVPVEAATFRVPVSGNYTIAGVCSLILLAALWTPPPLTLPRCLT